MANVRPDRRRLLRLGAGLPLLGLAACQLPGQSPPPQEFRVTPKTTFDELPHVDWILAVDRPSIDRSIDTDRIARVSGVEVEFYANATWVDRPPVMIQPLIIQSFLSSDAVDVVIDRRSEIRPDFMLQTNIAAFQAQPADEGPPEARVVIDAILVAMPRRDVVGTTRTAGTAKARQADLPAIADAFDEALGKVLKELVSWTLTTGQESRTGS